MGIFRSVAVSVTKYCSIIFSPLIVLYRIVMEKSINDYCPLFSKQLIISIILYSDGDFKINDGDDHHRSSLSQKDNLPP